jgi:hypothetical protein
MTIQMLKFCRHVVWGIILIIIVRVYHRLKQYTTLTLHVIGWSLLLKAWLLFGSNDPILFMVLGPILSAAKSVGFDVTESDAYILADPFYWLGLFFAVKLLEYQDFESSARVFLVVVCAPTLLTVIFNSF